MPASFRCPVLPGLGALLAMALALPAHAAGVVGTGTPASCTEAALVTALTGGGTVTFNCGTAPHTIVFAQQKSLSQNTSIDGGGRITLDGNQTRVLFHMLNALDLTLTGITLTRGYSPTSGGAIYARGPSTLTMTDVTLADNVAASQGGAITAVNGVALQLTRVRATGNRANQGGVIFTANSNATLTLNQFAATGNEATLSGGAIHHKGGTMLIDNSLFANNRILAAGNGGGAIEIQPDGLSNFTITNSTFSGNSGVSNTGGSAIRMRDTSGTILSSTFADNSGAEGTITAYSWSALWMRNALITSPPGQPNCVLHHQATLTSEGNNLQFGGSVAQSCGATIPAADPKLAPLANNGGFTQTMALQAGSPAIDAGHTCPPTDQRGVARPIGLECDIGAFEGVASPLLFRSGFEATEN